MLTGRPLAARVWAGRDPVGFPGKGWNVCGIGGVGLRGQENAELFRRLALWAAGR